MPSTRTEEQLFRVTRELHGWREHISFSGELDMMSAAATAEILTDPARLGHMSIDLSEVTFMDSAGLRPFERAAEQAAAAGLVFTIVAASSPVRRLMALTGNEHVLAPRLRAAHADPGLRRARPRRVAVAMYRG